MFEYYQNIECFYGHEFEVRVKEGPHDEQCPECGVGVVMEGEDILYYITERSRQR